MMMRKHSFVLTLWMVTIPCFSTAEVTLTRNYEKSVPGIEQELRVLYGKFADENYRTYSTKTNKIGEAYWTKLCDKEGADNLGKSGSNLWFSYDRKYILKTMNKDDIAGLKKIVGMINTALYTDHLLSNPTSLLPRIFDVLEIERNGETKTAMVMQNWACKNFGCRKPYDIKGSININNRFTYHEKDATTSELFELRGGKCMNFLMDFLKPFELANDANRDALKVILKILDKDAEFLKENDIMDYSLCMWAEHTNKNNQKPYLQTFRQRKAPLEMLKECFYQAETETYTDQDTTSIFVSPPSIVVKFDMGDGKVPVYKRLHFGIVDILQEYNSSKKSEKLWKTFTNKTEISCKPPHYYYDRFRYFLRHVFKMDTSCVEKIESSFQVERYVKKLKKARAKITMQLAGKKKETERNIINNQKIIEKQKKELAKCKQRQIKELVKQQSKQYDEKVIKAILKIVDTKKDERTPEDIALVWRIYNQRAESGEFCKILNDLLH